MSDPFLLSGMAMEAMDNQNMIKTTTCNKGFSPTTGLLPMPGQRPFMFDLSLQQAANVTPFAMQRKHDRKWLSILEDCWLVGLELLEFYTKYQSRQQ